MSLPLQPLDLGDLVRGQHLGEHPRDPGLGMSSSHHIHLFEMGHCLEKKALYVK